MIYKIFMIGALIGTPFFWIWIFGLGWGLGATVIYIFILLFFKGLPKGKYDH